MLRQIFIADKPTRSQHGAFYVLLDFLNMLLMMLTSLFIRDDDL